MGLVAALAACGLASACGRSAPLEPMGAAGSDGVDALAGPPTPPPPVAGNWLLYGFEDPVSVHLEVGPDGSSYDVTGTGCYAGPMHLLQNAAEACGQLHGHGAGLELEFSFDFSGSPLGPGHYAMSAHASRDGTRMAGTIMTQTRIAGASGFMGPYGWLRLEDIGLTSTSAQAKAPPADLGPLPNDTWTDPSAVALALQGDVPLGPVVPGMRIWEQESSVGVDSFTGVLGIFWNPDFHWDEATRTLTAGPVPETIPSMPVKLELYLDPVSTDVLDAVATLADGTKGTLLPAPPPP
jgi:hypothetical protein